MRISTKGRFAVNAMVDLALRESAGPVALSTICARQRVSLSYLEQLFAGLRQAGLVQSTRGPGGGYTLGRAAAAISVADIVAAVDDSVAGEVEAPGAEAGSLWARLDAAMMAHMAAISLQSLVDEQLAAGVQVEPRARRRSVAATPPPALQPLRSSAPNSVFAFGRSFAG